MARKQDSGSRAGVRWRRFGLVAVPAFLVSGAVLAATAQGALAASFAVAGTNFKISASKLHGEGMIQYGTVDSGADGTNHAVAVNAFKKATLADMCQSMVIPTPFKDMTILLKAGGGGTPVTATNLVTNLDLLNGNVVFNGADIGVDAAQSTKGPVTGKPGAFALQADSIDIDKAEITAWSTTAGQLVLKGLKISASFGKHECF